MPQITRQRRDNLSALVLQKISALRAQLSGSPDDYGVVSATGVATIYNGDANSLVWSRGASQVTPPAPNTSRSKAPAPDPWWLPLILTRRITLTLPLALTSITESCLGYDTFFHLCPRA